jgi:hypothetical protein
MLSKFFTFSQLTLLVALSISVIAAYYSIIGLTAIYAGAFIPIIIMGSILELGKVTATVWLRKYWDRCGILIKLYLVPAVFILAFITSMGIFGFLSRAHIEQGVPTGDLASKVQLIDEKIAIEQQNINDARALLKQLDDAVVGIQTGQGREIRNRDGTTRIENPAERALQVRRAQAQDRARITAEIQQYQNNIIALQEEKAPFSSQLRSLEAEVGPIKYIAAIIYGDNPDQNLLESAVRWVTILLVLVFDPLALVLILAANQSKEWDKEDLLKQNTIEPLIVAPPIVEEKPVEDVPIKTVIKEPAPIIEEVNESNNIPSQVEVVDTQVDTSIEVTPEEEDYFREQEKEVIIEAVAPIEIPVINPIPVKEPSIEEQMADTIDTEIVKPVPEKRYKVLEGGYVEVDGKLTHIINLDSEMMLKVDGLPSKTGFGTSFPVYAEVGNIFVRVDMLPNKVFKFNGARWIEQTKGVSDSYLTDEYLQFLFDKLASGEYDPDILTDNEKEAIETFIKLS